MFIAMFLLSLLPHVFKVLASYCPRELVAPKTHQIIMFSSGWDCHWQGKMTQAQYQLFQIVFPPRVLGGLEKLRICRSNIVQHTQIDIKNNLSHAALGNNRLKKLSLGQNN